MAPILDMTAGTRMFWYDKQNTLVTFVDKREESFIIPDSSYPKDRVYEVKPDILADWTKELPFEDNTFYMVVFDPPHLIHAGKDSWLAKKYGILNSETWQSDLAKGFDEAMRVLKPNGTLVFKWNDDQIKLHRVLETISYKPLFGDKRSKTHWLVFMKEAEK